MPRHLFETWGKMIFNPPSGIPVIRPLGPIALIFHKGGKPHSTCFQLGCSACCKESEMFWPGSWDEGDKARAWFVLGEFLEPYTKMYGYIAPAAEASASRSVVQATAPACPGAVAWVPSVEKEPRCTVLTSLYRMEQQNARRDEYKRERTNESNEFEC